MINKKSAKRFCLDDISLIENYQIAMEDETQMWDCHHRLEIQGQFRNSRELLKKCGMYYKVPAWQLIFLTHGEHTALHNKNRDFSEETKQKLREVLKGKPSPNKGKPKSAEHRQHLSEALKGRPSPNKGKKFSAEHKQHLRESHLGKKLSAETKQRLREVNLGKAKGSHWWNDGTICKFSKECPGPDFMPGRLKRLSPQDVAFGTMSLSSLEMMSNIRR